MKKDDIFKECSPVKSQWQTENVLTRWDTMGVFSPDPTAVKMIEKFGDHLLVGTFDHLKLYNWPCMKPGEKS